MQHGRGAMQGGAERKRLERKLARSGSVLRSLLSLPCPTCMSLATVPVAILLQSFSDQEVSQLVGSKPPIP